MILMAIDGLIDASGGFRCCEQTAQRRNGDDLQQFDGDIETGVDLSGSMRDQASWNTNVASLSAAGVTSGAPTCHPICHDASVNL